MNTIEGNKTACSAKTFVNGIRPWWSSEFVPYMKGFLWVQFLIYSAIAILFVIVQALFLVGATIGNSIPFFSSGIESLFVIRNSVDVVYPYAAIGVAPFLAVAIIYMWARKVCSLGGQQV